jgi:hypothetical protein
VGYKRRINTMGNTKRLKSEFADSTSELLKIFNAIDKGRVVENLPRDFLRPAYQYTKAEVGEIK